MGAARRPPSGNTNVGTIIGSRTTLVVDTGLGIRNGEIVLRELARLSKNTEGYVATTHFYAEHATGGTAFPKTFKFLRLQAQKKDVVEFVPRFSNCSSHVLPILPR